MDITYDILKLFKEEIPDYNTSNSNVQFADLSVDSFSLLTIRIGVEKIIDRELPAEIIFEDDKSLVFKDVNPVAPTHLLIIPKVQIAKISDAKKEDQDLLGHLFLVAGEVARKLGIEEAFRLVVNNGAGAQQTVFHLHIHLLADRKFNWPPG